jgi:hypothetical protein
MLRPGFLAPAEQQKNKRESADSSAKVREMKLKFAISVMAGAVCSLQVAYAAPPPDPCSLLTQQEVTAVLNEPVEAGRQMGSDSCVWSLPHQSDSIIGKRVTVTLVDASVLAPAPERPRRPGGEGGEGGFRQFESKPVTGVGDEAVSVTTASYGTVLNVKKGGTTFRVELTGYQWEAVPLIEKMIAMDVVKKL